MQAAQATLRQRGGYVRFCVGKKMQAAQATLRQRRVAGDLIATLSMQAAQATLRQRAHRGSGEKRPADASRTGYAEAKTVREEIHRYDFAMQAAQATLRQSSLQ